MRVLFCLAVGLTVVGSAGRAATAQVLYGSIVGTLTDETGAVVPKAVVTVTNTSTGLSRQATTDDAGYYSIPQPARRHLRPVGRARAGSSPTRRQGVNVPINVVTRVDATIQRGRAHRTGHRGGQRGVLQTTKSDVSVNLDTRGDGEPAALRLPQLPVAHQSRARAPRRRGSRTPSPTRRDARCRPTSTARSAAPTTRAWTGRPTSW